MNKQECDIMNALLEEPYINQRVLAEKTGHSLGVVNRSIKVLMEEGYLDEKVMPTEKAICESREKAPRNAIILAAGFGMRMVPINTETSKGLLEVDCEPLIERLIKQLHEVDVKEIYIVVGFMKEQYEYLIDEYGVELIVNSEYASKNNLHSMKLAVNHLSNSYIVPCDIWCENNPFQRHELYSWYMVSDEVDEDSMVRINRKNELISVPKEASGNGMIGIAYLLEDDAAIVREKIEAFSLDSRHDDDFWEAVLYEKDRMFVTARVVSASKVIEINTYEQLRELDHQSNHLKSDVISLICEAFQVSAEHVTDITVLKKGMTNRSFLFTCDGKRYIMRIPGEGTDQLINRREEAAVYSQIASEDVCDNIIYINPENGYKITEYLEGARNCNPFNRDELAKCMQKLREFHSKKLKVKHEFNLFKQIDFYESLWEGKPSVYRDYLKTKANVLKLKEYIEEHVTEKVLTHIDAVPDNFLFVRDGDKEEVRLIDWEYAGMQDPHVDVAMFCVYAMYDREHVEQLIDLYFTEGCTGENRVKIYCYIAVCGLLWSNWCEYKRHLGVEFGEYSLRQYRFAKDYYRIAVEEMNKMGEKTSCIK